MKNLANCTPREFFAQTVKIKRAAEDWMTKTDIAKIRSRAPVIAANMSKREKDEAMLNQIKANLSAMFDEIMERHPNETLNLLALLCFVEPEHIDDYPISDYLSALSEMLGSEAVIGFFTSLARLARTGILTR